MSDGLWKVDINACQLAILRLDSVFTSDGEQRKKTEKDQLSMRDLFVENDLVCVYHWAYSSSPLGSSAASPLFRQRYIADQEHRLWKGKLFPCRSTRSLKMECLWRFHPLWSSTWTTTASSSRMACMSFLDRTVTSGLQRKSVYSIAVYDV